MTPRPTQFDGFKEKMFWVIISTIAAGTVSMIGILWGLTVDVGIIKSKEAQSTKSDVIRTDLVRQALEMSIKNNIILNTKADGVKNEAEHKQIIVQLDGMTDQLHRVIMKMYGEIVSPDTTYIVPILDSIIYTQKLPVILRHKKRI